MNTEIEEFLKTNPHIEYKLDENDNLIYLDYSNTQISSLPNLSNLIHLKKIYCWNTNISYLPGIENCVNLKMLDCSHTNILNLAGIENCINLEYLNCANTNISSLQDLSNLIHLIELYCYNTKISNLPGIENCVNLNYLNCLNTNIDFNYKSDFNKPYIKFWQDKGLLPETNNGILFFKHTSSKLTGNMNFQYKINESFQNDGMACAGPFGTLQDYNLYPDDPRILVIEATKICPVNLHKGIFHIYEGTPICVYKANNITESGADLVLEQGKEPKELLKIFER